MPAGTLARVEALLDRALTAAENELFNVRAEEALTRARTIEALVAARNEALREPKPRFDAERFEPLPVAVDETRP